MCRKRNGNCIYVEVFSLSGDTSAKTLKPLRGMVLRVTTILVTLCETVPQSEPSQVFFSVLPILAVLAGTAKNTHAEHHRRILRCAATKVNRVKT